MGFEVDGLADGGVDVLRLTDGGTRRSERRYSLKKNLLIRFSAKRSNNPCFSPSEIDVSGLNVYDAESGRFQ